jgi:hypothetical protein
MHAFDKSRSVDAIVPYPANAPSWFTLCYNILRPHHYPPFPPPHCSTFFPFRRASDHFFSFIKFHFDYFYRTTTLRPKNILHSELVAKAMSSASPPSTPLQSTPGSIRSTDLSTSLGSPSFRVSTKEWSCEILALQPVNRT